jgi:hypothetical protein
MSRLEELAIDLYGHLYENMGTTDDWPLHVGGDDGEVTKLIRLLNQIQDELKILGYADGMGAVVMNYEQRSSP